MEICFYFQVTAEGPGLAKTGVTVNKWAEFTVDTHKAGKASLVIICEDDQHKPVNVEVVDKKNGTYTCKYMPKKMAKHTVTITYGGVQIPNSPYRVSNQTKNNKKYHTFRTVPKSNKKIIETEVKLILLI